MSDLLVRIVKMLLQIWQGQSDAPSTCVLGYDYERREARRSAIWVFCSLVVLFVIGWLIWRWMMTA